VKPKISVVTHDFPTREQPYRGAPIWNTLIGLQKYADLSVYCPVPVCPAPLNRLTGRRTYGHYPVAPEGTLRLQATPYFSIPLLTHSQNGRSIQRKLTREFQQQRPDLILSYWIYPDSYAAVLTGEDLGIPTVVCSRGSDLKIVESSRKVRESIGYTLTHATAILAVSADLIKTAERLGAPRENLHAVVNGSDSSIFCWRPQLEARSRLDVHPESRLVVFVGRLVAGKGIAQLLEAMARLLSGRQSQWKLVIVGEGPLESSLKGTATALGIAEAVLFAGALPAPRIAEWMTAADLFCLPSESEGCPNVIREALSCGCPVVATHVGGIPEMLNERNGILLEDNGPAVLSEALERAARVAWDRPHIALLETRGWGQVAQETFAVCEGILRNTKWGRRSREAVQTHAND